MIAALAYVAAIAVGIFIVRVIVTRRRRRAAEDLKRHLNTTYNGGTNDRTR